MQTNPRLSHQSHFDSIFNAIAPASAVREVSKSKKKITVYDIFWENRTDYIKVMLDGFDQEGEESPTDVYFMHPEFKEWLSTTGRLTATVGTNHMEGGDIVEDEKTHVFGYVEYIEEYMTSKDIKAFIQYKGLPYDFDSNIQ